MTFKHINFYDSPVMLQMERDAISKGLFKTAASEVEDIVKKASFKKESYEPSEDLFNDIVKLADGLRKRGFAEDAENLENRLLEYKVAETHLYRAIDEDGDDIIGFAHPDGEAKVG